MVPAWRIGLALGAHARPHHHPDGEHRELTSTTGGEPSVNTPPSLSSNGKRIVFELTGELSPDSKVDGEGELYLVVQD